MRKIPEGLYRRKNSKYYWLKIKGIRESTKTSDLNIARAIYNQRWGEIYHGSAGIITKRTVSDFVKEFEVYYQTKTMPRVYDSEMGRIRIFLKESKPYLMTDITFNMVSDFLASIASKVSPKTRKAYRQIIKTFLNYAIKRGYLKENVAAKTDIPKIEKKRPFFFSKEQIDTMLKMAPKHLKTILMIGLYTGMRIGEIMNLRWNHIDFKAGLIYVDKAKSKRFRAIPIHEKLHNYLSGIGTHKSGHIVTRADNKVFKYREGAKKAFKTLLVNCGIECPKGVLFHALRHSCASWLVMSGVPIYTVGQILGHKDATTTQIYAHLAPDYLKSEMEKLRF